MVLLLKQGVQLYHEDSISKFCIACRISHYVAIDHGKFEDFILPQHEGEQEEDTIVAECTAKKKERDPLIYYVLINLGNDDLNIRTCSSRTNQAFAFSKLLRRIYSIKT